MSKPTVLFLHGSWHTPNHFSPVREVFENAGFPTSCPRQPSVEAISPIGLMDDARCIRDELVKLVDEEHKDVIVVAHSYGGVVATQAVEQRFAKKIRENEGRKGGVVRLMYMCAFLLEVGQILPGAVGGSLPPFVTLDDDNLMTVVDPALRFYNDLPPSAQQHWISELIKAPRIKEHTALSHAAYLYHPVTYLYCQNDQALPYPVQKRMVETIGRLGVHIEEETCSAGHSPFLSIPETLLLLLKGLADELR